MSATGKMRSSGRIPPDRQGKTYRGRRFAGGEVPGLTQDRAARRSGSALQMLRSSRKARNGRLERRKLLPAPQAIHHPRMRSERLQEGAAVQIGQPMIPRARGDDGRKPRVMDVTDSRK